MKFLRTFLGLIITVLPTASYAAETKADEKLTLGFQEATDKTKPPVMTIDWDYVFSKWASGAGRFSMKAAGGNTGVVPPPKKSTPDPFKPPSFAPPPFPTPTVNLPTMSGVSVIEKTKGDGFGGHMTLSWTRPKPGDPTQLLWNQLLCSKPNAVVVKGTGTAGPKSPPIVSPPVTLAKIVVTRDEAYTSLKTKICPQN